MKFEVGGYYRNEGDGMMHVLTECDTDLYGRTLIAETDDDYEPLRAVGKSAGHAVNWHPITRDEWLKQFEEGKKA